MRLLISQDKLRSVFVTSLCLLLSLPQSSQGHNEYVSHQSLIKCTGASLPIQSPNSIVELEALSKGWIQKGYKLKPVGSLHSLSPITCTDGVPISLKSIKFATYNDTTKTATVGAGMTLEATLEFLESKGRTLILTPEWGDITIAGAIGTAAHSSSLIHHGTLSEQMVSADIINSKGDLQKVRKGDPLFEGVKLHLGFLGILVSVELETVPLFKVTKELYVIDDTSTLSGDILSWVRQNDLATIFWMPGQNTSALLNVTYKDVKATGDARLQAYDVDPLVGSTLQEAALSSADDDPDSEAGVSLFSDTSSLNTFYGTVMVEKNGSGAGNPATGISWRLGVTNCKEGTCPWNFVPYFDTSIMIPLKYFREVIAFMRPIVSKHPQVFISPGVVYIRFAKASSALLSTTRGQDSFVLEWGIPTVLIEGLNASDPRPRKWAKVQHDTLMQLVEKFEGFPHWGKGAFCYISSRAEGVQKFLKVAKEVDEAGLFQNKFFRDLDAGTLQPKPFCGSLVAH